MTPPFSPHPLAAAERVWTEQPEARALIMAMIEQGAQPTAHFETFVITRDEWREYHGPLADRLDLLRWLWLVEHDRQVPREHQCHQPTVAQAIDGATADPAVIPAWLAARAAKAAAFQAQWAVS